jgi:hypothetical protein
MRRTAYVLLGGLLLGLAAYSVALFVGSTPCRHLHRQANPELAWLQKEFEISDTEMARIALLHREYVADCMERCRIIDAKNDELKQLLAEENTVTPAITQALQEAALLRAECQQTMLEHFYQVSRTMPPEKGRRYLSWVIGRTLGPHHATMMLDSGDAAHERHGR